MRRVCVVCEGQTEETFVRDVLAPAFAPLDIFLIGETIETSVGHKGGALSYERVRKHLRNTLRQNSAPVVTTLIDLYRLDSGFPEYATAQAATTLEQKLTILTNAMHADLVALTQCSAARFIPYIQPYEFEALLFSDVDGLTGIETGWARANAALRTVRDNASSPEHINARPETKPAAHLERELSHPNYRKQRHGSIAASAIGLERIERECHFFAGWLNQLRALAS